ncbi:MULTISPECIES: RNA-binding protein [unclassified Rhizobium]|uniref:hypothetical protein n=1 Tax=unclassified Rhizobium TaxID=2613769 RepID=UPI001AD9C09B|nr:MULTISPECIES: hypothetical protein [unclassified Rhizobium]MBO9100604.1 hypothetical protein [Rhizobium sp. L58/93]MBO9136034.1 hypothetical protein [Rhizobium sp. B209b/85]MBO9171345.1 hypothetical protein [Rhizobium sp. L245/93]MBO9187212.1 hypothetical protein [Rhizobium sp. E27B/91]QXZ87896.1 hypothetical protein J5287_29910 [Rhizobium sp. K1/93]
MDLLTQNEIAAEPDFGHRLRQLRWFRKSFRSSAQTLSARYGLSVTIDEDKLAKVFIDWVEVLDAKKSLATVNRADFIVFAGGLALKELIKARPAKVDLVEAKSAVPVPGIVAFWPEGFLYTNYCISAVIAVHQQEFQSTLPLSGGVDDLRTWWSFKENTSEMPAYAVAFLDKFFGGEPNWATPDLPEMRVGMLARQNAENKFDRAPSTERLVAPTI